MRLTPAHLDIATAALRAVLPLQHPADSALSLFFRRNPQLGAQERAFLRENVFGVLRHRLFLESVAEIPTPRSLVLAHLARFHGVNLRELAPLISEAEVKWLGYVKGLSLETLPLGVRAEFPEWLIKKLRSFMGDDEILDLGLSLQRAAPLDLRVNSLLADRDEIIAALAKDGIEAAPTPYSPLGVRLAGKPSINQHPLFLSGKVEVQDEGSQLLGYLLSPRRRDMVVDFCAGAGGKTLMLGALIPRTSACRTLHPGSSVPACPICTRSISSTKMISRSNAWPEK
jgi:16S rRNA (cytosine967-C5)-methyltransferase